MHTYPPHLVGLRDDFIITSRRITTESEHQREMKMFLSGLCPELCLDGWGSLMLCLQVVLPGGGWGIRGVICVPHTGGNVKSQCCAQCTHSFSLPCKFGAVD